MMPQAFKGYTRGYRHSNDLTTDVFDWFRRHDRPDLAEHTHRVHAIAVDLAARFGLSEAESGAAALLHDVARIIPPDEMVGVADACGLQVYPEEAGYPDLLHQRLSAQAAKHVFGVTKPVVLQAVGCHTTLRPGCSELDMLLMLADKLSWDRATVAPFAAELERKLLQGIRSAAAVYMDWLWQQRESLKSVHPWMRQAYAELSRGSRGELG